MKAYVSLFMAVNLLFTSSHTVSSETETANTQNEELKVGLINADADGNSESRDSSDSASWHPDWHSLPFPDQPLQLVKPDTKHKKLQLVERNFKLLQKIEGAVATVAVVGKFHTGKSFLLNQLMGKYNGFGVGPFVKPHTMGIWMWGKPLSLNLKSGQRVSVVFLDTEGFAANNVSENYDAKIFAVSTLLSSFLIYNSVKIIDQSDIDYLELLSRRTQLFALRSQLSRSKWTEDFNHDLLSFPPLLWVVQDFVQQTVDGESPRQWLHRLMESHTREKEDYEISLLSIFKSVDCQTMFLPATKRDLLMDLSQAREGDLTPEYRQERDHLINTLRKQLTPKEKNERPISGPELASLLEILVEAANEGSLAAIPSRWDSFIQRLETGATEDCLRFYEGEMALLYGKHAQEPVNPDELSAWHEAAFDKSLRLLEQLLFGLGDTVKHASKGLSREIKSRHAKNCDMNDKRIRLKCRELQHRQELDAEERLAELVLPMKTSDLLTHISDIASDHLSDFTKQVEKLASPQMLESHQKQLQESISVLGERSVLKNREGIETILKEAVNFAVDHFKVKTRNEDRKPRQQRVLDILFAQAKEEAEEMFQNRCDIAVEETAYAAFKALVSSQTNEITDSLHTENEEFLHTEILALNKEIVGEFISNTDSTKMPLPLNHTELENRLSHERRRSQAVFDDTMDEFRNFDSYSQGQAALFNAIEQESDKRRHENMKAFFREVQVPLETAKKIVLLSADKYNTQFSLLQFIRTVCLLNLNEGKPKHWSSELKDSIIDDFMKTDVQLKRVIKSKENMWSTVMGFFQWLAYILTNLW